MSAAEDNHDHVGSSESLPSTQRMSEHDQMVAAMQASLRFEQDQIQAAIKASLEVGPDAAATQTGLPPGDKTPRAAAAAGLMSEDEQLQAAVQASLVPEEEQLQTTSTQASPFLAEYGNETGSGAVVTVADSTGQEAREDPTPKASEKEAEAVPAAASRAPVSMPNELRALDIGDEPEKGARIQFRMPNGKRVIRKFDSSQSVKHAYAYVAQSIPEVKGGRGFVLRAGFPPKDLIGDIEKSIEASSLDGVAISVCRK